MLENPKKMMWLIFYCNSINQMKKNWRENHLFVKNYQKLNKKMLLRKIKLKLATN